MQPDKRSPSGRRLTARLSRKTILEKMPKLYFVQDDSNKGYRVGRTDWPGDTFNIVPRAEFETFRKVYEGLDMPLLDKTWED